MDLRDVITIDEFVSFLKSDDSRNIDRIIDAFECAKEAHGNQMRHSGLPYYTHPLAVAYIVAQLKMDDDAIVSALLHDVIEDTNFSFDDISERFGFDVTNIVDGVTKLGYIEYRTEDVKQSENFRKLFLGLSTDIRILMVKLCDRMHNMLTISHVKNPSKRRSKAIETLDIYIPLAQKIGAYKVKNILQDICFDVLLPKIRKKILRKMNEFILGASGDFLTSTSETIQNLMMQNNIKCKVYGRQKEPYSIWQKMVNKKIPFEKLQDLVAFRVIVDTKEDCYKALYVFHSNYSSVPGYFMDYISTPKQNGYESIHTTIIDNRGKKLEMQIRTHDMEYNAEYGMAAHLIYKRDNNINKDHWVSKIVSIINDSSSHQNMLDDTRLEMYQDKIISFTTSGEVVRLPLGATVLDFAFNLDDKLGTFFHSAEINGHITMDFGHKINNGDQIMIHTSESAYPDEKWMQSVITGRAKSKIRDLIKDSVDKRMITNGSDILAKFLAFYNASLNDEMINFFLSRTNIDTIDNLYIKIGSGLIDPFRNFSDIMENVFYAKRKINTNEKYNSLSHSRLQRIRKSDIANCELNMPFYLSPCCNPTIEDNIIGRIDDYNGIIIHNINCDAIKKSYSINDKYIELSWNKNSISHNKTINLAIFSQYFPYIYNALIEFGKIDVLSADVDKGIIFININMNDINSLEKIMFIVSQNQDKIYDKKV